MQLHIYKIIFLLFTLAMPVTIYAQTQKKDTTRKSTTTIPEKKITKYTLKGIVTGETDDETLPGAHIYVGEVHGVIFSSIVPTFPVVLCIRKFGTLIGVT